MAGHHLTTDPAIEKWGDFRTQQYRSFRWTPKTTFMAVAVGLVVPGAIFYLGYWGRHWANFRGNLRGESAFRDDLLRMQKKN